MTPPTSSIVDLVARQRQRVEHLARVAKRFMDPHTEAALGRLSARLSRLACTLALPSARVPDGGRRLGSHLERLVRDVSLLRVDDPAGLARVAWVLAEMEETLGRAPAAAPAPVFTAN
ncbi:MAG: hypothetical protein JWO31_1070 [Phycisphaerales bacterium]|nr:hypothetical protein [Phycisphaerales bacterium]